MNQQIKKKWVKALVSGKYKQGSGLLLDENGKYCCLGVLGRLMGMDNAELHGEGLDGCDSYLNQEFTNKAGLVIKDFDLQFELASVNDAGVPFEMIAALIDDTL